MENNQSLEDVKITYMDEKNIKKRREYALNKVQEIVMEEKQSNKSEDEIKELLDEIHEVIAEISKQMDYQMRHSYIGKDGKDYFDFDTVSKVNEDYARNENPEIHSSFRL